MNRRHRRCSNLPVEMLEDRTLLSVSALFSPASGKLSIKGDCDGKAVLVEGTGVEGEMDVYWGGLHLGNFTGVKHIEGKFGSGDDYLQLAAVEIPGKLNVKMGGGEDTFLMDNSPFVGPSAPGDLKIGGKTTVNMGNNPDDFVKLSANAGDHGVYLKGNAKFLGSPDVDLRGAGGTSVVESHDVHIQGNLSIKLSPYGDANGDGENLRLRDVNMHGTTKIVGATGNDKMEIYRSQFAGPLNVNLRGGDDLFDTHIGAGSNRFNGPVKLNGGFGTDTYDQSAANQFFSTETFTAFESLT